MGVSESPDISTEIMTQVLDGLDVDFYMDDIAILRETWDKHIDLLQQVLQRLQDAGFTINPMKCKWAIEETDFLGHTSFTTQRVLQWRLLLEEFQPTFCYKQGITNFIADALSRVPTSITERREPERMSGINRRNNKSCCRTSTSLMLS